MSIITLKYVLWNVTGTIHDEMVAIVQVHSGATTCLEQLYKNSVVTSGLWFVSEWDKCLAYISHLSVNNFQISVIANPNHFNHISVYLVLQRFTFFHNKKFPKLEMLFQNDKRPQKRKKKKPKHTHPMFILPLCMSSLFYICKTKTSEWIKITDSSLGATVNWPCWCTFMLGVLSRPVILSPWYTRVRGNAAVEPLDSYQCAVSQWPVCLLPPTGALCQKGGHLGAATLEPRCITSIDDMSTQLKVS